MKENNEQRKKDVLESGEEISFFFEKRERERERERDRERERERERCHNVSTL